MSTHYIETRSLAAELFILLLGFLLVAGFAFILIPGFNNIEIVDSVVSSIKANEIDAGSLFYTDIEVASESEIYFLSVIEKNDE